jgi:putative ATPase
MSRNQADVLLPEIEDGTLAFIGATTENPFHAMSSALISRSIIFKLESLNNVDIVKLIIKVINYYKSNDRNIKVDKEAIKRIVVLSSGDGRKAMTIVDLILGSLEYDHISIENVNMVAPDRFAVWSKDEHFDGASWLQGSIQASDPDAAIYALARWLESGEDPRYIARRLMVSASEDSCSTPEAALVAHNAYVAACEVGRPECDIILAHAVVLIACAPRDKSAAKAIWNAVKDVRTQPLREVPKPLKDCHYPGAEELGHGSYKDGSNQSAYIGIDKIFYHPPKDSKFQNPNT